MDRLRGRVALVTGASSGIGAEICRSLLKEGMIVVGAARGVDRIKDLVKDLDGEQAKRLLPVKCDLSITDDIYALFETIKKEVGGVDVCVNNAGISANEGLLDGSPTNWRYMMDINVLSLCLCTKLAVASMRERNINDGHVIHISSMGAHEVIDNPAAHFYSATKHAVKALAEGVRKELRAAKSNIRMSTISPGLVETEILLRATNNVDLVKHIYSLGTPLQPSNVASTLMHIISCPQHVQINDVIIVPTDGTKIGEN